MGYGFGKKMNQYCFEAKFLPTKAKTNLRYLNSNDTRAIAECFNRAASKVHGMIFRPEYKFKDMFTNLKVVGYEEEGRILGFIAFRFKQLDQANMIRNNILLREFIYENRSAFQALLAFLKTQHDQIHRIVYNTPDDHFHHLLFDPRSKGNKSFFHISQESNIQGVGMMYRVIDTSRIFELLKDHNFGNQTLKLKITLIDTFLPENDGIIILKVADFSSLILGVISFRKLYNYNIAEISDPECLDKVNTLFLVEEAPITTEPF
jgi:predicted acetyltransferase